MIDNSDKASHLSLRLHTASTGSQYSVNRDKLLDEFEGGTAYSIKSLQNISIFWAPLGQYHASSEIQNHVTFNTQPLSGQSASLLRQRNLNLTWPSFLGTQMTRTPIAQHRSGSLLILKPSSASALDLYVSRLCIPSFAPCSPIRTVLLPVNSTFLISPQIS